MFLCEPWWRWPFNLSFPMNPILAAGFSRTLGLATLAVAVHAATPFRSIHVGATPESAIPGFNGNLYVTLMGTSRIKGDGDGKIVKIEGDQVIVFTEGLDDPKGLVFIDGALVTADFDKVWAVDASGKKRLLAGPAAFPTPPLFLNDVAIAPGGTAVLVTDMGNVAAMNAPGGAMWPLDSSEAKNIRPLGRVYRVTLDGKVSIEVDHAVEMPDPNGIDVLDANTYLLADFFRGDLLERKGSSWRVVSPDHRTADGIAHDHSGNIFLTEVRTGKVWKIRLSTGEPELLATLPSAADLYLDEAQHQLIVPDSKSGELVFIPLTSAK